MFHDVTLCFMTSLTVLRNDGGLLTRLQPVYVRRFTAVADLNLNTLLGIVVSSNPCCRSLLFLPYFINVLTLISRLIDVFL